MRYVLPVMLLLSSSMTAWGVPGDESPAPPPPPAEENAEKTAVPATDRAEVPEGVTLLGEAAEEPPMTPVDRGEIPPGVTLLGDGPNMSRERVVIRVRPRRSGPMSVEPSSGGSREARTIGPSVEDQLAAFGSAQTEAGSQPPSWSTWEPEESLERTDPGRPYPWNVVSWTTLPAWFEWRPPHDLPHTDIAHPYPWNNVTWAQTGIPSEWKPKQDLP